MTPSSQESCTALWHFAVQAYARPGVAASCLQLQDAHGLDVDVLLACTWLASLGVALDREGLERLLGAAAPPHARVLELRSLRRALGSDREHDPRWQATYEHLLAAELAAERVELDSIEAALSPLLAAATATLEPAELALANLRRYAARHGPASCDPPLVTLVERVLPRSDPARD